MIKRNNCYNEIYSACSVYEKLFDRIDRRGQRLINQIIFLKMFVINKRLCCIYTVHCTVVIVLKIKSIYKQNIYSR